ncbi:MAG: hypothetical protein ACREQ4_14085 [Candidatus Binataceae bacterium]
MLRTWLIIVMLAMLLLGLTGCPALMLGSLGYEGYKYEKTGTLPGMPSQTTRAKKKASPQPTPPSDGTE